MHSIYPLDAFSSHALSTMLKIKWEK